MKMKRLLVIFALVMSVSTLSGCEDEFKTMCEQELGGKVTDDTKSNFYSGTDSSGKFVTGTITETTRFCIADGKVVAQS